MTGLWPEGCGGALRAQIIKKGRGSAIGHTFGVKVQRVQRVQRVQKGRFLGLTGPIGREVLKFDGPLARGWWYRPYGR